MNSTRPESVLDFEIGGEVKVPVARPRLPLTEKLLPYLRLIDESRWYSNSGPLVEEFEARLALHAHGGAVAAVANATVGLTLALLASDIPPGSLCMVPAWTFAATGHAIRLAGLSPPFDLDEIWSARPNDVVFGGIFTCCVQMASQNDRLHAPDATASFRPVAGALCLTSCLFVWTGNARISSMSRSIKWPIS
jgi:hypothetical protein